MVNEYVEVLVNDLEKDWVKIEDNLYHAKSDTQQYLKKVGDKFYLESWYIYHHLHQLKTIKHPVENTNY